MVASQKREEATLELKQEAMTLRTGQDHTLGCSPQNLGIHQDGLRRWKHKLAQGRETYEKTSKTLDSRNNAPYRSRHANSGIPSFQNFISECLPLTQSTEVVHSLCPYP